MFHNNARLFELKVTRLLLVLSVLLLGHMKTEAVFGCGVILSQTVMFKCATQ